MGVTGIVREGNCTIAVTCNLLSSRTLLMVIWNLLVIVRSNMGAHGVIRIDYFTATVVDLSSSLRVLLVSFGDLEVISLNFMGNNRIIWNHNLPLYVVNVLRGL